MRRRAMRARDLNHAQCTNCTQRRGACQMRDLACGVQMPRACWLWHNVDAASRRIWLLIACVLCGAACGAHDTDGEPEQQQHGGTGGMPKPSKVGSGTGGASGSGGATSASAMSVEPSANCRRFHAGSGRTDAAARRRRDRGRRREHDHALLVRRTLQLTGTGETCGRRLGAGSRRSTSDSAQPSRLLPRWPAHRVNRTDYGCDGGQLCGPFPRDGRVIVGKPLEYVKTAMKINSTRSRVGR